jgi:hypothetical protein
MAACTAFEQATGYRIGKIAAPLPADGLICLEK